MELFTREDNRAFNFEVAMREPTDVDALLPGAKWATKPDHHSGPVARNRGHRAQGDDPGDDRRGTEARRTVGRVQPAPAASRRRSPAST